ncbi:hypothetical protein L3X38_040108 [Prunus dulcis]|uniref:Uncharacterized protein n=1 Tax=Prunus dulcis TaxID=3755 RepID=A0AAD4V8G5_PRUDU|nr:hypothetical protein L3X38_040108 [Prunus dulcis]
MITHKRYTQDPHFIGSHAHGNVTFGVDLNAAPEVVLGPAPFSIGGEVSNLPSDSNGLTDGLYLPETYVPSARNPLRDLGGKPPAKRQILAFYVGNVNGYLRPIILEHWKDKDPGMKIFGPMPPGVAIKK